MNIYFSGIGGVGIGPLAQIAADAGYAVVGSDREDSPMIDALRAQGIAVTIGQDGSFLRQTHEDSPIDWFVYTSALPTDHPELLTAQELGIRTAKRDELLAHIIAEKNLKLIAIAGTHGKTTTTGMMVWTMQQLGIPVSYSIGTTLSWGPSGHYHPDSAYFIYECDEYDRNFLHFQPHVTLITSIEHDHPDTYPTKDEYFAAFDQFISQSRHCIMWQQDFDISAISSKSTRMHLIDKTSESVSERIEAIRLAGRHNRENAYLVLTDCIDGGLDEAAVTQALESFPGTNRRFEKLADNLYSDYGHTPTEIAATLQMAREISDHVVLIYQPHQNRRQHEVRSLYTPEVFNKAEHVYWLPTYLSREDPNLDVLSPTNLIQNLSNAEEAHFNDELWETIQTAREEGKLVLCTGAGTIDQWVRQQLLI